MASAVASESAFTGPSRSTFHKPSEKIIQDNLEFFHQVGEIEEVIVFGHSVTEVDVAYFDKLKVSSGDTPINWTLVHQPSEGHQRTLIANLIRIGFPPEGSLSKREHDSR